MVKEWSSVEKQTTTWLCVRLGSWMASDAPGEIKDEVHILPRLSFWFNHSDYGIRFCWLVFDCHLSHFDYRRWDEFIRKARYNKTLTYCRYCRRFEPLPYLDYGYCNLTDKHLQVFEHECCEHFENKSKRKWWQVCGYRNVLKSITNI